MVEKLAIEGGTPVREKPYPPWPYLWEEQKEEVREVLDSGKLIYWTGERGRKFQEKFARFCGVKYGIAVHTGTAALHVALASLGIGPGDEVIVPPYTFIATSFAVVHQNAVPVFADVEPETGNISPEEIKEKISPYTKAIIAVHLAGHPARADEINQIAKDHNLLVIEDAAQAHGAEYKGKKTGSLGDIAAFSFCNDKIFTTGGEGGMVVTDNPIYAERARSFKDHGYEEIERRSLLELEALYTYIHHRVGYNYRMTEMQAAIGLKAMERLNWNIEKRRENAHYLSEKLKDIEGINPAYESPEVKHSFYKYYASFDKEKFRVDRDTFVKAVRAEGVPIGLGAAAENYKEEAFQKLMSSSRARCLFQPPCYKGTVDYTKVDCPNARERGRKVFVLPVHPTVKRDDLDDTLMAIEKVTEAYRK